ncbi:MAG TPA: S8 family serine peptidase [Microbacteriaceae bacterium]|nr:S8 family serine peptidase [Microbacteriaceae bacterium]
MRSVRRWVSAGVLTAVFSVLAAPAFADTIRDREYWLSQYGFSEAWDVTRGAGVTVAVIDTGIDGSVADLRGAVVGGIDQSGMGSPDGQTPVGSESEHGTLVASVLAGRGTGGSGGVIGVAPEASLLSVSVAFGSDSATKSNDDQIADGIRWAVDNGAKVINMSLTRNTPDWPQSWDAAFQYAFDHDVVVVAAAGNRGSGTDVVGAPATIPGVLTVAGVNRTQTASTRASSQGITISVAAPSEEIVGAVPGGGYVEWSGTSAAAPIVSGLVALVRAAHPDLDANNVIQRVIATATPKSDHVPSPIYGYGLINPPAAVSADVPRVSDNPMGSLADWIRIHRRAVETPAPGPTATADVPADPARPPFAIALFPTPQSLATVTLPLILLSAFGTLSSVIAVAVNRRLSRAQSHSHADGSRSNRNLL